MQSFPRPVIESVVDAIFGLEDAVFRQMGELGPPDLFGITVRDGAISSVTQVQVLGDFRERMAKELRRVQAEFDLAVVAVEAWTAPDTSAPPSQHPLRKECVSITVYSKDATYSMMCDIARNPSPHLIKTELGELESFTGRIAPDGGVLNESTLPVRLKLVRVLLEHRPPEWKQIVAREVEDFFAARLVAPLAELASDPMLPQESIEFTHRLIQRDLEFLELRAPTGGAQRWLVAAHMRVSTGKDRGIVPRNVQDAIFRAVGAYEQLAAKEGRFEVMKRTTPLLVFAPAAASVVFNASVEHLAATMPATNDIERALQQLRHGQILQEDAEAYLRAAAGAVPPPPYLDALVLGLCELPDATAAPADVTVLPWRPPELLVALGVQKKLFSEAAAQASAGGNLQVECRNVLPVFDAMRDLGDSMRSLQLAVAVVVAKNWRFGRLAQPRDVVADVTVVQYEEAQKVRAVVTLWTLERAFLLAVENERAPDEAFPEFGENTREALLTVGVKQVRVYPKMVKVARRPQDPGTGEPLIPDFNGGWMIPAPKAGS